MAPLNSQALLNRLMVRARLRHMQALIRLMDLRNMGRAAAAMGITQPALSQLVADLEDMIELKLFLRHSKGVDPLPVAHDLARVARRVILAMQDGSEVIASRLKSDSHFVKVAATAAAAGAVLSKALPAFSRNNPMTQVQVTSVLGRDLEACLSGDEHDVVCCRQPSIVPSGWVFTPIARDELVVVCSTTHPHAMRRAVSLDDLERANWLTMPVGSVARQHFEALADQLGWQAISQCHVTSHDMMVIWPMLDAAAILALVPRSIVVPWLERALLVVLDTEIDIPLDTIGFLQRLDGQGSAARAFANTLLDCSVGPSLAPPTSTTHRRS